MQVHITPKPEWSGPFQYEFWNANTRYPVRVVPVKGKWRVLGECFEGHTRDGGEVTVEVWMDCSPLPPASRRMDLNTNPLSMRVSTSSEQGEPTIKPTVQFTLPRCEVIPLVIRVYELNYVDRIRSQVGWSRIADVVFSDAELRGGGTDKPTYSRSDLYYLDAVNLANVECTCNKGRRCNQGYSTMDAPHPFTGYNRISARSTEAHGGGALDTGSLVYGHPVRELIAVMRRMIMREKLVLEAKHKSGETLSFDNIQCLHPLLFFVPGLPVIPPPLRAPSVQEVMEATDGAFGFTPQSFFYYRGPAATEAWFLESLTNVLACRGRRIQEFEALVTQAKRAHAPYDEAFHECLQIASHVIRMHTCSRPYVPDHAWFEGHIVCGDQETMATALPGDCEDSACTGYMIHMTLLLEDWRDPNVRLLRACAAMLGVPFVVCGTFADPCKLRGKAEAGHMYGAAIPFVTLGRMLGERGGELKKHFKQQYGFDMPAHHEKPAIMEGVFRTTMFYSDHRGVSRRKRQLLEEVIKPWLFIDQAQDQSDVWCWDKYTCMLPMDKNHRAQGQAFRVFSDYLAQSYKYKQRSFALMSNLYGQAESAAEGAAEGVLDTLFPMNDGKDNVLKWGKETPRNEKYKTFEALREHVRLSTGSDGPVWGVPIELLACGHQTLNGRSLLLLEPTADFDERDVHEEVRLRGLYDRPIVPLLPRQRDWFLADAPLAPSFDIPDLPPKTSNDRVTIYAYHVDAGTLKRDTEVLRAKLKAKRVTFVPYAFSTACIFTL